jgi:hypothetical protein
MNVGDYSFIFSFKYIKDQLNFFIHNLHSILLCCLLNQDL